MTAKVVKRPSHISASAKKLCHGCKYSKSGVLQLRALFDEVDVDGTGKLSPKEMAAALERKIGEGQSMHVTYLDVFRAADLNHDNELSFEELLAVMYPLANNKELGVMLKWATRGKAVSAADTAFYPTAEELEELKAMFCLYDKDRNATLDLKELRAAASSCGFNAEEVERLFEAADVDKDKKISFDEFVQMMSMCYM